jgi:hypothetical protein
VLSQGALAVDGDLQSAAAPSLLACWSDACRRGRYKAFLESRASGKLPIRDGEAMCTLHTCRLLDAAESADASSLDRVSAMASERCRLPRPPRCRIDSAFPIA